MKTILIALVAAGALVGCNRPDRDVVEQSKDATQDQLNAQKRNVDQAADAARARADAQNKAEKAQITAQEKAEKAQIEADKAKVEAQASAQKKVLDAQEDAAQGTAAVVSSGTATSEQTFLGRITSVNKEKGTLTVADANRSQEFKLQNPSMTSDLRNGETVSVKFHQQNGVNIADSVDLNRQLAPENR